MSKSKTEKTYFQIQLEKVRESLPTGVIEIELNSTPLGYKKAIESREHARIIRNTILSKAEKRLEQLLRTKRYRRLQKNFAEIAKKIENTSNDKKKGQLEKAKNKIAKEMTSMQKNFKVTYKQIEQDQKVLRSKYNKAHSVISQRMAERAWKSIESRLYHGVERSHYIGKDYFRSIEGKQNDKCIMLKCDEDGKFYVSYLNEQYDLIVKKNDIYVIETLTEINNYFNRGNEIDLENIENLIKGNDLKSTYRVKYNRIIFKEIRGKIRLFVQIVFEGVPVPRRKKDWTFRHTYGVGRIGNDIGNQSVAIVSENHVELKNLADRTSRFRERKIILLQRYLDRSRRANNPDCFDNKGRAIKRMHTKSKRYIEAQKELRNLHRIMAENRKLSHREDINRQRAIGDELFTESANYQARAKRAKETSVNEKTGKINRKKRAGKSILNRSPGEYHSWAKYRFKSTGGKVHDVNTYTFKASQYDHKLDDANKKQLSKRWHEFEDGEIVQRDCYSGFLMFCSEEKYEKPDKKLCDLHYDKFKKMHDECIEKIKQSGKDIKNSGIKVPKENRKTKLTFKEKKKNSWFAQNKKVKSKVLTMI